MMKTHPYKNSFKFALLTVLALLILIALPSTVEAVDFSHFSLSDAPPIVIEGMPLDSQPFKSTRNGKKIKASRDGAADKNGDLLSESEIPMVSSYFLFLNSDESKILLKLSTNEGWVHQFVLKELQYDKESNQIVLLNRLDRIPVAYNTGPVSKKSELFKFVNYHYTCFDWNLYSKESIFLPSIRIYLNRSVNCKEKLGEEKFSNPDKI